MKKLLLTLAAIVAFASVEAKTMYEYIAWEAAFWPENMPVSAENYHKLELDRILSASAPIDTVIFSPCFGFGSMAAKLTSAEFPKLKKRRPSRFMDNYINMMPECIAKGIDPIAETIKWCRANKKEVVVALPLNFMQHHGYRANEKNPANSWSCFLYPPFKTTNAKCLMDGGDVKVHPPFAAGEAVDYANDAVVNKYVAIATEICSKYDIDGVLVDTMLTHPYIFKTVADGGVAEAKEVAKLTAMVQKVKAATAAAAKRLGHKVTCAARVPDSPEYCKAIGIDLVGWMDQKIFDYMIYGGRFQLNPWKKTAEFMAKYNVPFYAGFGLPNIPVGNDSGYASDDERIPHITRDNWCHAARTIDALHAGAAGVCYINGGHHEYCWFPFNINMAPTDKAALKLCSKRYFNGYTNVRQAGNYLKDGLKYATCDKVVSNCRADLGKGVGKYTVEIWDDIAALKKEGNLPKLTLIVESTIPSGLDTEVTFNAKKLKSFRRRSGTQWYELTAEMVKLGANEVIVKSVGRAKRGGTISLGCVAVEVEFAKKGENK